MSRSKCEIYFNLLLSELDVHAYFHRYQEEIELNSVVHDNLLPRRRMLGA